MTNSTMPASVKDAAVAIRADLKTAFPATKFSVPMGIGTASAYIDVTWTDGPNGDMVRNVTDRYEEFGSPVDGISRERRLSIATLLRAQELVRAVLPDFEVYDGNGKWVTDWRENHCPIFYLGGWRFGGGSAYSALTQVADLLILNPRKGPVA